MFRSPLKLSGLRHVCSQCRQNMFFARTFPWLSSSMKRLLTTSTDSTTKLKGDASFLDGLSSLSRDSSFNSVGAKSGKKPSLSYKPPPKPHHLHVFAKRHNCHVTLTAGNRDAILSVSSGMLNFRKSARGNYDAAFQLCAFMMAKIKNMGLLGESYTGKGGPIRALEICFRDFGPGREAMRKILMGQEGSLLRKKVTRVMDGTRLKFGGTRSKRRRRV